MSGHTKGPWDLSREPESDCYTITFTEESGREWCLADVYGSSPVAKANATLISSAPDLLEALEAITDLYSHESSVGESSMRLYDARSIALLAISKAKGK